MNKQVAMGILLLAFATAGNSFAQMPQAKADQKPTFSAVLGRQLSNVEREVVSAAEAMPEDKFNFAPSQGDFKGVRTFAQQVKHIAAVNYMLGAGLLAEKSPVDVGSENGPDKITSKADVVNFLKESFAYLHKSLDTINENNVIAQVPSPFGEGKSTRLGLSVIAISHPMDHYGQMVEYLRMNNIIPPASRNQ